MRYWISWWQPGDDPRPKNDPPKDERVIGWWITGGRDYTHRSETAICAVVRADSEDQAMAAVAEDWPESMDAEWRFLMPKEGKWVPPSDRFPAMDWMTQRHAAND